jgi:hypothetical protein
MRKLALALIIGAATACGFAMPANALATICPTDPFSGPCDETISSSPLVLTVDVVTPPEFLDVSFSGFVMDVQVNPGNDSPNPSDSIFQFDSSFALEFFDPGDWTVSLSTLSDPPSADIVFSISSNDLPIVTATPLPASFPLFAGGLGLVGFLSRRRKRNASAAITA